MNVSSSRLVSVRLRYGMVLEVAGVTTLCLVERPLDLRVEDDAAGRGEDALAAPLVLDGVLERDRAGLDRELDVLLGAEAREALDLQLLRELPRQSVVSRSCSE